MFAIVAVGVIRRGKSTSNFVFAHPFRSTISSIDSFASIEFPPLKFPSPRIVGRNRFGRRNNAAFSIIVDNFDQRTVVVVEADGNPGVLVEIHSGLAGTGNGFAQTDVVIAVVSASTIAMVRSDNNTPVILPPYATKRIRMIRSPILKRRLCINRIVDRNVAGFRIDIRIKHISCTVLPHGAGICQLMRRHIVVNRRKGLRIEQEQRPIVQPQIGSIRRNYYRQAVRIVPRNRVDFGVVRVICRTCAHGTVADSCYCYACQRKHEQQHNGNSENAFLLHVLFCHFSIPPVEYFFLFSEFGYVSKRSLPYAVKKSNFFFTYSYVRAMIMPNRAQFSYACKKYTKQQVTNR